MLTSGRRLGWATLAAAAAVALAACGGGTSTPHSPSASGPTLSSGPTARSTASVGVTDTQVTVVSHQPLTGTSHPGTSEIAPAAQAYFGYLNARGGVFGRHVDFRYANDAGTPTKARAALDDLLPGAFAVLNGQGTEAHEAVTEELAAAGVPDLFVGSGCGCVNAPATSPETFGWQPSDEAQGAVLGHYIARAFPGQRVGVLYENDELGQEGLRGLQTTLPATQLVDVEDYAVTAGGITGQVARLRAKQAQVVVNFGLPTFTATLTLIAAELGWRPQIVAPQADPATLSSLLEKQSKADPTFKSAALLDGLVTDAYLPSPDDTANPWIALFRRIHDADAHIANSPFDANTVYGMAMAYTFAQALTAAGPNLTRAGLVAALEKTPLSTSGPGLTALTYSATNHSGFAGVQLGTIVGGKLALSGPVYVARPGGAVTETVPVAPKVPPGGVPAGSGASTLPTSSVPTSSVPTSSVPTSSAPTSAATTASVPSADRAPTAAVPTRTASSPP